jgi:hypothetical protein
MHDDDFYDFQLQLSTEREATRGLANHYRGCDVIRREASGRRLGQIFPAIAVANLGMQGLHGLVQKRYSQV